MGGLRGRRKKQGRCCNHPDGQISVPAMAQCWGRELVLVEMVTGEKDARVLESDVGRMETVRIQYSANQVCHHLLRYMRQNFYMTVH